MVKIIKVFNFIYSKCLGVHIFQCIKIIKFKIPGIFKGAFQTVAPYFGRWRHLPGLGRSRCPLDHLPH